MRFLFPILILCLICFQFCLAFVEEAPDGSVCFNGCSGHGDCVDYSCHCYTGYIGDDCSTTFADTSDIVPILTAGHFNITRKNFTQTVSKHKLILVGFSSYSCHKCIQVEPSYRNISKLLKELKIPFARANADQMKSIATEVGAVELPALVLFHKRRPILYKGAHTSGAVLTYVKKQLDKPAKNLKTVYDVTNFIESRKSSDYGLSTAMTVGIFSEHDDIEEDDYEEFMEVAKELQLNEDFYFGVVTNPATAEWFKLNKTIDRTPALLMVGEGGEKHTINLNELFGSDIAGIKDWILKKSIPLVGKITGQNFGLYEKQGLPILMMFLDLTDEHATYTSATNNNDNGEMKAIGAGVMDSRATATEGEGHLVAASISSSSVAAVVPISQQLHASSSSTSMTTLIGGRSGGIFNEVLLDEFRQAAKEHVHRILFVYLDGVLYQDQMRSLGLYGGKERLPSIAFNTRNGAQVPFPEELPINKDTILQFCADYISGKLRSAADIQEMAKKALQAATPINMRNQAVRQQVKTAPAVVQGVSEQFGDGLRGDHAVVTVTRQNFDEVVLNEDKDVVLLLHSQQCEACAHLAVYFKRMADRFHAMNLPSLTIARMDVSHEAPPPELNLMVGNLPLLVMIPALNKLPPFTFYSGISKVQQMMKWVHEQASVPFELENLPHLSEKDKEAYKVQVREREEALDKQRTEEKKAMQAEERAQAEVKRRQRKAAAAATASTTTTTTDDSTTTTTKKKKTTAGERVENKMIDKNMKMTDYLMDSDEF